MSAFNFDVLMWPSLIIFFSTFSVSLKFTHWIWWSIFASFIKAGIFLIYYNLIFDGTYTFFDDISYLEGGASLLYLDIGLENVIENWQVVEAISKGKHFIYYLYNAYAIKFFGYGYYAPVTLNILLTIFIAYLGSRLAVAEFHIGKRQSKFFYLFLLLHPDIVSWSTVMNGKDMLVLLSHVVFLIAVSAYFHGQLIKALVIGSLIFCSLFFIRYYLPVLFAGALVIEAIIKNKSNRAWHIFISTGIFAALIAFWIGSEGIWAVMAEIEEYFINPVYGFVRMTLTPIPFNADENYAFLNLAATFHWMAIPFIAIGLLVVWREGTPFSIFFIIYLFMFIALYSTLEIMQGPRHRVQLDYAIAILEFLGFIYIFRSKESKCNFI